MKKSFLVILVLSTTTIFQMKAQIPSTEVQIASAVLAAAEQYRQEATVLGYNEDGAMVTLRKGSNEMICLADNPTQNGFNVSCYLKELEPFMERGRALRAEGKSRQDVFDIRGKEVESGKIKMPASGATLSIYSGPDEGFNRDTGEVTGATYRYVVYMPYATAESTGLSLKPEFPGGPWLMDPGTHRAHIMITPVPNN